VAKRQAITNPENTVYSIKRFMGRRYDEVSEELKWCPIKWSATATMWRHRPGQEADSAGNFRADSPKVKKAAEDYLGEKVTEVVITVPAYFNDAQRQATKDAGKIAGLEVKRIINEPTAAALAYGLDKGKTKPSPCTTSAAVRLIFPSRSRRRRDRSEATNGDTHLGGDNIDQKLVDWLIDEFKKDEGLDLRGKATRWHYSVCVMQRSAQDRTLHNHGDGNQSSFYYCGRIGSEASGEEADAGEARVDGGRHSPTLGWPVETVHERCGR